MSRQRTIPPHSPGGQIRWGLVIALGIGGIFFWPLLLAAVCVAVSQSRGPNHYTKFMVPYAYRFKWDPAWIVIAVLAVPSAFMIFAWLKVDAELGIWGWIAFFTFAVAALRVTIWLSFRFPFTAWFFVMLIVFLFGIGWRARFFF